MGSKSKKPKTCLEDESSPKNVDEMDDDHRLQQPTKSYIDDTQNSSYIVRGLCLIILSCDAKRFRNLPYFLDGILWDGKYFYLFSYAATLEL